MLIQLRLKRKKVNAPSPKYYNSLFCEGDNEPAYYSCDSIAQLHPEGRNMRSLYRESKKNHSVTSGISSQHFSPGHGRRESNGLGRRRRWHWKPKQIWQDYCPSEWGRFTTWRQHLNLNALRLKSFFLLKVELADTFKCNSIHFSKKCVTGVTLTRQEKETRGARRRRRKN